MNSILYFLVNFAIIYVLSFLADINKRYPHFNDLDKDLKIVFLFNNADS